MSGLNRTPCGRRHNELTWYGSRPDGRSSDESPVRGDEALGPGTSSRRGELLESADAEGYEEDSEAAIHAARADEIHRRSRELQDGSIRGLSVEEARSIVASSPADDDR